MEQQLADILQYLGGKFPILLTVYIGLCTAYPLFCWAATLTKTDKDDKFLDKVKVFFSIPVKKEPRL